MAYDVMTERYEITTILQGELVRDPDIAGRLLPGTPEEPTFYIDSVHNLMKTVSGAPLLRPAWFFDTDEQGEALADVGTHLVDLARLRPLPRVRPWPSARRGSWPRSAGRPPSPASSCCA